MQRGADEPQRGARPSARALLHDPVTAVRAGVDEQDLEARRVERLALERVKQPRRVRCRRVAGDDYGDVHLFPP